MVRTLLLLCLLLVVPLRPVVAQEVVVPCTEDAEPIALPFGASTTCSISPATDSDLFTVTVPGPDARVVRVTIRSTSNGADPRVEIFGPGGFADSFGCDAPSTSTCAASKLFVLEPGVYTLVASESGANQTMGYQLGVEVYPPDDAPVLEYGDSASFSVNPNVDYDWWRIPDVASGAMLRVTVASTSNGADPRLLIVDASGMVIAAGACDAPSTSTCSFQVNHTVEHSGDLWLAVHEGGWGQNMNGSIALICLANCEPPPSCAADLDGNGFVDSTDLALLLATWGEAAAFPSADLNTDGDIDAADLAILLGEWGPCD
ncbi:MAG: dockerin type I repeat-containing protein [Phycisphaerales bacterium]|nr:dockerin type I repeat-containing protein [Phycisphaerales bacterium]